MEAGRPWAALVSEELVRLADQITALEGGATTFRPVFLVPNHNPIPVHDVGHGTLITASK